MATKKIKDKQIKDGVPQFDAFVLTAVVWNREAGYNFRDSDVAGVPMRVFLNEKRATEECLKLNINELMTEDLIDYLVESESFRDIIKQSGIKAKVKIDGECISEIKILPGNTDEAFQQFIYHSGLCFFEVSAVKLDTMR